MLYVFVFSFYLNLKVGKNLMVKYEKDFDCFVFFMDFFENL